MLILTRYKGETITIGDDAEIQLTVLDVVGKQIRVGIDAPRDIAIYRGEIYKKINTKNN